MLHINLLGTPEIYIDALPSLRFRTRKAQALLIYLTVTEERWTRDALATLFWPESNDTQARKNLRDILPSLRKHLPDYLSFGEETIEINSSSNFSCDVTRFSAVMEKSLQTVETHFLVDTLDLYRGEFLEGYGISKISADFEQWAMLERERLQQLALMGFTTLCQRQKEAGLYEDALTTNRQLLKLAPWDEAAHRQKMLLLVALGEPQAALHHYATCQQILVDELDVEPAPETVALYEQIRSGDYLQSTRTNLSPPSATVAQVKVELAQEHQGEHPQHVQEDRKTFTIPHNLPASLSTLIGYVDELTYIQTQLLLHDCRLLTIVGLGGVGKTHLAMQAARQIIDVANRNAIEDNSNAVSSGRWKLSHSPFRGGVYFIQLAPLREEASTEAAETIIAVAIARAINYTFIGDASPQIQLETHLHNKKMLLVLDNIEHLLAGASLVAMLLQQAPHLRILVTSRERLDLQGEQILALQGLNPQPNLSADLLPDLPSTEDGAIDPTLDEWQAPENSTQSISRPSAPSWHGNDAVTLFAFRAQQADRHFRVDDENIDHIVHICELVGGLPLGIELAVRLLDVFDCATVAREIAQSLDLLITSRRDIPQRHHTLRAVFDQSWVQLPSVQQTILMRLSFFRPNFQAAAALSVANASPHDLAGLVNKSLLGRTAEGHFTLHQAIRQFAHEKLAQSDNDLAALEEQYALFYLGLLANYTKSINSAKWSQVKAEILNDIANIKAALSLAIQKDMWMDVRATVESVGNLYDTHAWFLEGANLCKLAAERLMARPLPKSDVEQQKLDSILGHLMTLQGLFEYRLGHFDSARTTFQNALSTIRRANATLHGQRHRVDKKSATYTLTSLRACLSLFGSMEYGRGQPKAALALLQESVKLDTTSSGSAVPYYNLARVLHELGDYQEAQAYAEEAIQRTRHAGAERFTIFSITELGRIEQSRGNYKAAKRLFQECYEFRSKINDQTGLVTTLGNLGEVARLMGNYEASATYIQRGLALADQIEYATARALLLWALGNLALEQENYTAAKAHFLESQIVPGFNHFAVGLPTQGWADIGLAEFVEAEQYFYAVVKEAQQTNAKLDLLEGLGGLILLLTIAGEIEEPAKYMDKINQHPATTRETKDRIQKMYVQMMNNTMRAKGKAYYPTPNLCKTIEEILVDTQRTMAQPDGQST